MRYNRIFLLSLLIWVTEWLPAQVRISGQGEWFDIEQSKFFLPAIAFNAPIQSDDHPWMVAFKSYFAPTSFDAFQDLFLPQDWNGMTEQEYQEWQHLLAQNPLFLEMAMEVQDKRQQKYLLLFYTMEHSHYRFYQSKVMKWVDGSWKHKNLDESGLSALLEYAGSIQPSYLNEALNSDHQVLALSQIPADAFRTFEEKFTIESLVPEIRECLISFSISQEDIDHALKLLLLQDKEGMIAYLSEQYKIEDAALMYKINTTLGFDFYNFFHSAYHPAK
jgi:hypothetical protein